MNLRGYRDQSPVRTRSNKGAWPSVYVDEPYIQYQILKEKYRGKEPGRIPLPNTAQEVWAHHKYSVLARDKKIYKNIGRGLASKKIGFEYLSMELVKTLRIPPSEGGLRNALQHMWGYVSDVQNNNSDGDIDSWPLKKLLTLTQENVKKSNVPYLAMSTALSELMVWV
ncbi:MAG: YbgA family protein [Gammaproteobacteria bacterium]|nr:YbgA family protein [Gammaproteobacteria bacterium]